MMKIEQIRVLVDAGAVRFGRISERGAVWVACVMVGCEYVQLVSHRDKPREFKTLDAAVSALKYCGIKKITIEV